MANQSVKDLFGRLAAVDLGQCDDGDDGCVSIDPFGINGPISAASVSSSTASTSGESSSDVSVRGKVQRAAKRPGIVNIKSYYGSEIDSVSIGLSMPSAVQADNLTDRDCFRDSFISYSNAPALVPSNVPTELDIRFSPVRAPPTHGLIIQSPGVEAGGGWVNVTFVDCRFDAQSPTIFSNCRISNVTFRNCDFSRTALENVVMRGNSFDECKFSCAWRNRELSSDLAFFRNTFTDEMALDEVPKAIVAQDKARKDAEDALLAKPAAPNDRHPSGWGKVPSFASSEDEYTKYHVVKMIPASVEPHSIPLTLGKGIVFEDSPVAGLHIKDGYGCKFEGVRFERSNFRNTLFDGCHLVNVTFKNCIFLNASFKEVAISNRTYQGILFDGCAWKWRSLRELAEPIKDQTFRQGGLNGNELPEIMQKHGADKQRIEFLQQQHALNQRPRHRCQQKLDRRDFGRKTEDERVREQLVPGEVIETYVEPTAIGGRREDVGTTFVMLSFD